MNNNSINHIWLHILTMEDISKLEHLSLVSKICVELDNHSIVNDKDVGK